ncbi:MAG: carboxymuconolactone decarboxylase family protein [Parachlamydiaceae bacterium]|nr:carboxymuconolactone decarboxylase family protein [Parachlamydiaceae bacterium]
MSRINPVKVEEAQGELKEIYQQLEKKMGKVINIFQNLGHSPAALKGMLGLMQAGEETSIPPQLREKIALIVGQTNSCNYCLSAHTSIAKKIGINDEDILKARHGKSEDLKSDAILQFVKTVVTEKGQISNQDVDLLKKAGVSDKELVEIILLINLNMFTNYFNLITGTPIDFPLAPENI